MALAEVPPVPFAVVAPLKVQARDSLLLAGLYPQHQRSAIGLSQLEHIRGDFGALPAGMEKVPEGSWELSTVNPVGTQRGEQAAVGRAETADATHCHH